MVNKPFPGRILAAAALVAGATLSSAITTAAETGASLDEIVLKNGSRILGNVTATRDGVVSIDTEFAGTLSVKQDQIESMHTQEPVVMQLLDGTVVEEQPIVVVQQELILSPDSSASYTIQDLSKVNPEPWELGNGYRWGGLASLALVKEDGNTDTEELDYKLESVWRSLQDRYTLRLVGEVDEANGVKNAENWTVTGKYDRFLDGPWYWGVNASAEQDKFSDLQLRTYIGPYAGRQFFDEPALSLSAELGLAYVKEDYITAENNEYPGMNWSANLSSNYLGGDSRLYVDHTGIVNLEEPSAMVLNTTFGLAFPLMKSVEAAAELLLEYDSGAVEGVEELDQTYRFRIGYKW